MDAIEALRAVVGDPAGEPIELALYAVDRPLAVVRLSPARALALAGQLIAAATARLPASAGAR